MRFARITLVALSLLTSVFFALPASHAQQAGPAAKVPTFSKDVAPILFKNCAECHRSGEAAPFSVLTYKEVRPWAKSIREKVVNRTMPPWHADPHYGQFANERRLSKSDIETVTAWVDNGAVEGAPGDLPSLPKFVDGWNMGRPDQILSMPNPYTVEATGPDEYQYFEIETGFTEDKYVRAVEVRPGNRKVVHHVVVFIKPPAPKIVTPTLSKEEQAKRIEQFEKESIQYDDGLVKRIKADAPVYNDGCELENGGGGALRDTTKRNPIMALLTVWAPGRDSNTWASDVAKRIPAGSNLVFQVHYNKSAGTVQTDRSSIGLIFAKGQLAKLHTTELIFNAYMQIPPGAERHRTSACWTAQSDMRVTAFMPHMHFRGAAMQVEALYPDGRKAMLLNVPQYDFSWQTNYSLKEPLLVPKGTKFIVTGWFDNSTRNRFNPDPTKAVRWGEPTYDEMLACFIDYTVEGKAMVAKGGDR